ncbi:MAG: 5'-nucleotidase C-terminal domain-containing protein [Deltaproteobacteria bacterium]|nr:5'-nucleotidase C-terminal domain-containing protein [Deltaproteobacteria bacterium]
MSATRNTRPMGRFLALAFGLLLLVLSFPVPAETGGSRLVVLHTNDHHGHPLKFSYYPSPAAGGLPARATLVRGVRRENRNVLLLDAGDLNTGRPESDLFSARPDILGYNALGYDAMVLGNHEFDHPLRVLKEQMAAARFPFLSANIRTRGGGLLARPYLLKDFGEFRVAVFGLTTKDTEHIANPKNVKDLLFDDEIQTARRLVPFLRRKADIVIALTHMGIFESVRIGSKRLAAQVEGIDLIVDGHSHTRLESPVMVRNRRSGKMVPIVQAWKWGLVLGRVDLEIHGRAVRLVSFRAVPVNLKTLERRADGRKIIRNAGRPVPEDPALLKMLQPYLDKVNTSLSKVIGYAESPFSNEASRHRETALGDLVADSMLWATRELGADFALQNGGGIRSGLPRGPITRKILHEILPFDNTVVVLTLKGRDLIDLLNHLGAKGMGSGAFPQISRGITLTLDARTRRCRRIRVHGRPIDTGRVYRVATNSFLADGGDGCRSFLKALQRRDTGKLQREILAAYIQTLGEALRPRIHGRIRVIGAPLGASRPE